MPRSASVAIPRPEPPAPRIDRRVTLADVARAAGVHRTTVALALRNHPGLPGETLARLKTIARKMGYRPDPTLAALNAYRIGSASRANVQVIAYVRRLGTRDRAPWKT
jgi:LacI family transcriptional regulator